MVPLLAQATAMRRVEIEMRESANFQCGGALDVRAAGAPLGTPLKDALLAAAPWLAVVERSTCRQHERYMSVGAVTGLPMSLGTLTLGHASNLGLIAVSGWQPCKCRETTQNFCHECVLRKGVLCVAHGCAVYMHAACWAVLPRASPHCMLCRTAQGRTRIM